MPKQIVVIGPPGTGKCIDPGTLILTDRGLEKAGDLCRDWPMPDQTVPLSVGVYGLFGRQMTSHFYNGGVKARRKIKTRRGFEIVGTPEHPMWAMRDGVPQWIKMGDLNLQDRVALQRGFKVFAKQEPALPDLDQVAPIGYKKPKDVRVPSRMTPYLAEWLGWFVSEGCNLIGSKGDLGFCNYSPWVIERMKQLNESLFGLQFGWRKGSSTDFSIQSVRLKKWLKSIGVDDLSADKKVPDLILISSQESQKAYLRAAFEADGWITERDRAVGFMTASSEMARQVQVMLLNFGIMSSRREKFVTTKRWGRRAYHSILITGNEVSVFAKQIGFYDGLKSSTLTQKTQKTRAWDLQGLPSDFVKNQYDRIRASLKQEGIEKSQENKKVVRSLSGRRGDVQQKLVARSMVRYGLLAFSDVAGSEGYQSLLSEYSSRRVWEEIDSLEDIGEGQVVDLTVPEGHSFNGNGFVCHNTRFMTDYTEEWFNSGVDSREIAYLAFTKAAANEAAGRIMGEEQEGERLDEQFPYFRTIHSLAYRGLRKEFPDVRLMTTADMKGFSQWSSLDGTFTFDKWEDIAAVYQRLQGGGKTEWDDCMRAYTISRISCRTEQDIERAKTKIARKALQSIGMIEEAAYQIFVKKYEQYKSDHGLVDFTDMLAFGLTKMNPIQGVRHVVIDEAQDLSPICVAMTDRLFQNAETCHWAGDEDQCQPAGTQVVLTGGQKVRIENLKVGNRVRAFNRHGGSLTGFPAGHGTGGGVISAISNRQYSGPLYQVEAGGRTTCATDNHRFFIRWLPEARFGKICVTYLMQRGPRFRVGWCQLFNNDGKLHLIARGRIEKADRVWILKHHENRTAASIHESVVAARYGIPTVTFEPVNGANHLTEEALSKIFSEIGDRSLQASACLEDHGRSIKYPFHEMNLDRRHKSTIMEVTACNLIQDLMALPMGGDTESVEWSPLKVSSRQVKDLTVYGLTVDKFNSYIADGIVVHNCIYLFTGADPRLFIERFNKADEKIFLRQTHRFGQEIWDLADIVIHRVPERIPKNVIGVKGRTHDISVRGKFEPFVDNALILHRHVAGCQWLSQVYRNNGLPFRNERGDDPLGSHKQVENFRTLNELADGKQVSGAAATEFIAKYVPSFTKDAEGRRQLVVRGAMKKLKAESLSGSLNIEDLQTAKILTSEGAEAIRMRYYKDFEHADEFEYFHRVVENGYKLTGENMPTITTIHGSKGRQAKRVTVFSEMGKKCWQDADSEHRLAFVAMTRTEGILEVCAEQTVEWAELKYDYPVKTRITGNGKSRG